MKTSFFGLFLINWGITIVVVLATGFLFNPCRPLEGLFSGGSVISLVGGGSAIVSVVLTLITESKKGPPDPPYMDY